jgi:hypothetical protein
MLEKTKAAIAEELTMKESPVCPLPGSGTVKVLNALKEDAEEILNNQSKKR